MGNSYRYNKSVKIAQRVRQRWICKTFLDKEERGWGLDFRSENGELQVVEEEKNIMAGTRGREGKTPLVYMLNSNLAKAASYNLLAEAGFSAESLRQEMERVKGAKSFIS